MAKKNDIQPETTEQIQPTGEEQVAGGETDPTVAAAAPEKLVPKTDDELRASAEANDITTLRAQNLGLKAALNDAHRKNAELEKLARSNDERIAALESRKPAVEVRVTRETMLGDVPLQVGTLIASMDLIDGADLFFIAQAIMDGKAK